jgi:HK97 family phage prohead protease
MPLANFHACRVRQPAEFEPGSFRTVQREADGKPVNLIIGTPTGATSSRLQAFRYPAASWTIDEARAHCSSHEGTFEPAVEEDSLNPTPETGWRFTTDASEIRLTGEAEHATRIVGYASVFDSLSEPLPFGREIIKPGAFKRALRAKADVRALFNHNRDKILGRTKSGTVKLREDSRGLHTEINPPNTSTGREVMELVRRGDVSGMSFQFHAKKDRWRIEDGEHVREVLDADLIDVSVVTWPAYESASAEARSYRDGLVSLAAWEAVRPRPVAVLRRALDILEVDI